MHSSTKKIPAGGCSHQFSSSLGYQRSAVWQRRGRRCGQVTAVTEVPEVHIEAEPDVKPYFRKFQSEGEHLRASIREWKDISAEGVALPQPTARSKLLYILYWIKYTLVPEPVRYVWWIVWSAIRQAWYPYHKKAVLEGARLDTWLRQQSNPDNPIAVSRKIALRRFHWKMNAWDDIVYRYPIVKAWLLSAVARRKQKNPHAAEDAAMAPPTSMI